MAANVGDSDMVTTLVTFLLVLLVIPIFVGLGHVVADHEYGWWAPRVVQLVLRLASALLPTSHRSRYHEEWTAELDHLVLCDGHAGVFWSISVLTSAIRMSGTLRVQQSRLLQHLQFRMNRTSVILRDEDGENHLVHVAIPFAETWVTAMARWDVGRSRSAPVAPGEMTGLAEHIGRRHLVVFDFSNATTFHAHVFEGFWQRHREIWRARHQKIMPAKHPSRP